MNDPQSPLNIDPNTEQQSKRQQQPMNQNINNNHNEINLNFRPIDRTKTINPQVKINKTCFQYIQQKNIKIPLMCFFFLAIIATILAVVITQYQKMKN